MHAITIEWNYLYVSIYLETGNNVWHALDNEYNEMVTLASGKRNIDVRG